MKIESVESILFGGAHFVRLTCDNGIQGIGQSGCWAYPEAVHAVVGTFERYLHGNDPTRTEHYGQYFHRLGSFRGAAVSAAISAIDIALWDIKGKYLDVPIWQLLGGRYRNEIRLYVIVHGNTAEELASRAQSAVADGFTAVKMDPLCPGYQDLPAALLTKTVVDCVAAVRETIGYETDLMCEFHRKLTPMQFVPIADELAKFRLAFLEDGVQTDSIASQAALAQASNDTPRFWRTAHLDLGVPRIARGERRRGVPARHWPCRWDHGGKEDLRDRRIVPFLCLHSQLSGALVDRCRGPRRHGYTQLRHPGVLLHR